jgi:hypothetical protein
MVFKPRFLACAVGSMPHADAAAAVDVILANLPEAPVSPQLSGRGLNEQMEIQYSEGMPCRVIDRDKGRMYFETSGDYIDAFTEFYEAYIAAMDPDDGTGDVSSMAISPDYAAGIYELENRLRAEGGTRPFVKCQTTGPCSFALTIVDENKRALWYNEEFRDVIIKALAMKCRWQIQKIKELGDRVICFIDEPILSGFGSSTYVSVSRDEVIAALGELVEAIHAEGALAGIHCCGNTEWSIPIDAGADIVNFDAFQYGETIAMYPDHVKRHLENGNALAWGVVPTSIAVRDASADSLLDHYEKMVDLLVEKSGVDRQLVYEQTILTGSCGTGSMEVADAERVFKLTGELSRALRAKHGV